MDARTPITEEARPYRVRVGIDARAVAGSEHACSDAGQLLLQGGIWYLQEHEVLVEGAMVANSYLNPFGGPSWFVALCTCQSFYILEVCCRRSKRYGQRRSAGIGTYDANMAKRYAGVWKIGCIRAGTCASKPSMCGWCRCLRSGRPSAPRSGSGSAMRIWPSASARASSAGVRSSPRHVPACAPARKACLAEGDVWAPALHNDKGETRVYAELGWCERRRAFWQRTTSVPAMYTSARTQKRRRRAPIFAINALRFTRALCVCRPRLCGTPWRDCVNGVAVTDMARAAHAAFPPSHGVIEPSAS